MTTKAEPAAASWRRHLPPSPSGAIPGVVHIPIDRAMDLTVVLRHVKIEGPWTQRAGHLAIRFSKTILVVPIEIFG